ncbi:hypothetical protein VNO80_13587 [Phaseolus coccineus]|uniref:Uncharacterized protein n=1 Tax=Phaseolus coccineus TaxID=3886 RepID=A0AAN9N6H5_PHACN
MLLIYKKILSVVYRFNVSVLEQTSTPHFEAAEIDVADGQLETTTDQKRQYERQLEPIGNIKELKVDAGRVIRMGVALSRKETSNLLPEQMATCRVSALTS